MANTYSAGIVTAYGAAKKAGYTGTYEEFCAEQASFARNAQQVRQDKESVEQTVTTFSNTTVPAAVQSVTDEGTAQVGLVTNAGTTAVGNVNDAGTTQVGNVNSAGQTQVGNVNDAGTTQVGNVQNEGATQVQAVEDKGAEVIASIPSDYSDLTAEVDDLTRQLSDTKMGFENAEKSEINVTKSDLGLQNNTIVSNLYFTKEDSFKISVTNNTPSAINTTLSDNTHSITLFANINAGATRTTFFTFPYDLIDGKVVCYVNNTTGSISVAITKIDLEQSDIAPMFRKNRFQIVEINVNPSIPLEIDGEIAPRLSGTPSPASPATIEKTANVYVGHCKTGETTNYDTLTIANGGVYLGEYNTKIGKVYDTGRIVTFNGTEPDWLQLSNTHTFYIGMGLVKTHPTETTYGLLNYDFACTHYPNKPYDGAKFVSDDPSINQCCGLGLPQFGFNTFVVNDNRFSTLTEWKEYLATTNLQIVYRSTKSNPTEYSFSSLPPIYARWETEKIDACYTSSNRPLFTVEGALPIEILKDQGNPLYGKLALFMGDSICYGGENTKGDDVGRAWAGRIADTNNMNYFNYGISGLKIAKTLTNVPYIAGWIDTLHTDHPTCDYLILEGGANDADTIADDKIGTLDESDFSGEYDDTTFYGALDTLFYKAVTYYPNAKIGYIVAQKMGTSANVAARRYQFFEYAMNACKKWGIPFINLWEDGQLNPNLTVYYDPSLSQDQNIAQGKAYRDGQHLTPVGYDIISPKIAEWMKTL